MTVPKYKRVLFKLGGEALAGQGGFGISPQHGRRCRRQDQGGQES